MRQRVLLAIIASCCFWGIVMLIACSAPEYRFASSTADANTADAISDTTSDTGNPSADAVIEAAAPLDKIVVGTAASTDFAADCTSVSINKVFTFVKSDDTAKRHCYLYFPSEPYRRTWPEAKVACGQISTLNPPRTAHLATFPGNVEATSVQDAFNTRQVPWIGLELANAGAPTAKESFQWITGEPNGYDGWVTGSPSGVGLCVAWAENSRWQNLPCEAQKGLLCELDE